MHCAQAEPITDLQRPLSGIEYYHASVGTSAISQEPERRVVVVLTGRAQDTLTSARLQAALDQVVAVNPGLRLRLQGVLGWTRWTSDGLPPRLLTLPLDWDGLSDVGTEPLLARPLDLRTGPTVELLWSPRSDGRDRLILRSVHAIMDGMGALFTLQELFRALRGEPLIGTRAAFSDVDLMRAVQAARPANTPAAAKLAHEPAQALTGRPTPDVPGDQWRRFSLGPPTDQTLARVAVALAHYHHQHHTGPAVIGIPVDLRSHCPGLTSTLNFSSMVLVRLLPGEGPAVFRERLKAQLAAGADVGMGRVMSLLRWFPMRLLDRLLGRTTRNLNHRKPLETAVISWLGRINPADYRAPDWETDDLIVLPLAGSVFTVLSCWDDELTLMVNLPNNLATDGRFDALQRALTKGDAV